MLIRDSGDSWTAITQPAHAFLAGQIARYTTGDPSPDFVLGVEQHDVPWTEWDRTPPLNAEAGRPASFIEAPMEKRLRIWRHAARRLDAQNPYAALLVSLHATNIHTRYIRDEALTSDLLEEARADQDGLLAVLPDVTREQAERDADLLFVLDALSLALCNGWGATDLPPAAGETIRFMPDGDGGATLEPWPLAVGELTVAVHARRFTERFADEPSLHRALAAAPRHVERWRLRPGH